MLRCLTGWIHLGEESPVYQMTAWYRFERAVYKIRTIIAMYREQIFRANRLLKTGVLLIALLAQAACNAERNLIPIDGSSATTA
ncbi:hypothetical protein A1507_06325 [Methylomonas koyamae]|uniref:Uncharacterized protein n=2 Tax=Methylomonas koyamae TaxID=702114 RepID=A0A177NP82_9GAMM|nr:hypothetical protein A1507_06325 [Methylomonas koyamae]